METFTFAIVVPPAPGSREILEALADQVARDAGLGPDEARHAAETLGGLAAERLGAGGPVRVAFARARGGGPIGVEIAGDGPVHSLSWPAAHGG